jgi:drug/metabolite transporter (DMT)-like permease
MRMWIAFSLIASILWGLTYAIDEQVYKTVSIFTALSITSLFAFLATLFAAYLSGRLGPDLWLIGSSKKAFLLVMIGTLAFVAAEFFIGLSISNKNATLAGLIEISYPIFIAVFAELLFKEAVLNAMTILGAILVVIGVLLISIFNR